MTDLIRVAKDGVAIDVHPDALQEHITLGWSEAPATPGPVPVAPAPAPTTTRVKPKAPAAVEEAKTDE